MTEISRRNFLIKGGAGAAALGGLSVLPAAEASAAVQREPATATAKGSGPVATSRVEEHHSDSLVVHIPDTRSGEIHYLIGKREIVQKDKALVARLLREAR